MVYIYTDIAGDNYIYISNYFVILGEGATGGRELSVLYANSYNRTYSTWGIHGYITRWI